MCIRDSVDTSARQESEAGGKACREGRAPARLVHWHVAVNSGGVLGAPKHGGVHTPGEVGDRGSIRKI
eukprot:6647751-Alexandrium_andersonii.AAC.1